MEDKVAASGERRLVPRFRRGKTSTGVHIDVDIDDAEAQALIEKDLRSDFIWTSDTTRNDVDDQQRYEWSDDDEERQCWTNDESHAPLIYDLDHVPEQWKMNVEMNERDADHRWIDDDDEHQISLSLRTNDDKDEQRWTLDDSNAHKNQWNLVHSDDQQDRHDLHSNEQLSHKFLTGDDDFLGQVCALSKTRFWSLHLNRSRYISVPKKTMTNTRRSATSQVKTFDRFPLILLFLQSIES